MTFELTTDQIKKAEKWIKRRSRLTIESGTIGGRFSYKFIPTGTGIISIVEDMDGTYLDLTDYTKW